MEYIRLLDEVKKELKDGIIPFWAKMKDDECGGFYGGMSNSLKIDKKAVKSIIQQCRILWFWSACTRVLEDRKYLNYATHAVSFIKKHFIDEEYGGVYWSVSHDGKVADSKKQTYASAYAIYAFAEYYLASQDPEGLIIAKRLYNTVEENCRDEISYIDTFNRDFTPTGNLSRDTTGDPESPPRTMSTVLHLIEGYTVLLEASRNDGIKAALERLLYVARRIIFDEEHNKLFVNFDKNYNVLGDLHSYGHDIEMSWIIDKATRQLRDPKLIEKWDVVTLKLADNILKVAFENGALNNENHMGMVDKKRIWWVEAEAVVGFLNAFEKSGDDRYEIAALSIWNFIKTHHIDTRPGSEWWAEVDYFGRHIMNEPMAGPWKGPYHNGRMCLEIIERRDTLAGKF
jgi:mannobiose 2-epimerase